MSLIEDLFPNMALEKSYNNQLSCAIAEIISEMGLVNHPAWTLKLIQVWIFLNHLKDRIIVFILVVRNSTSSTWYDDFRT